MLLVIMGQTGFLSAGLSLLSSLINHHHYYHHHHLRLTSVVHAGWIVSAYETPPSNSIQNPFSMQFNQVLFHTLIWSLLLSLTPFTSTCWNPFITILSLNMITLSPQSASSCQSVIHSMLSRLLSSALAVILLSEHHTSTWPSFVPFSPIRPYPAPP